MISAFRSVPWVLWALAAGAAAVRAYYGWTDHGIHWPDEIYQSLEPAHGIVYGRSLVAWEYVDGARSWALPGLFALVLGVARFVGLDEPGQYLFLVRVLLALVAAGTVVAVFALARVAGASVRASLAGAAVYAFAAPFVFFGHRALGEVVTTLPVAAALALGLRADRRWVWLAAALLAAATLLRLQNGLFAAGFVVVLLGRRDWRAAVTALGVLLLGAFVFGLLDRLTWGTWFESARVYLEFNVEQDGAARFFGEQPFSYYFTTLAASSALLAWLLLLGGLAAIRRAPGLWVITWLFLLSLSLTGHKELRFVLPGIPLLCALAAVGIEGVLPLRARTAGVTVLAAAVAASALVLPSLSLQDVGQIQALTGESAWKRKDGINRLLMRASSMEDVCGVAVMMESRVNVGAMTYLHRDAGFYEAGAAPEVYSHAIVFTDPAAPTAGSLVALEEGVELRKLRSGCAPDPGYTPVVNQRPR